MEHVRARALFKTTVNPQRSKKSIKCNTFLISYSSEFLTPLRIHNYKYVHSAISNKNLVLQIRCLVLHFIGFLLLKKKTKKKPKKNLVLQIRCLVLHFIVLLLSEDSQES